jgi:murein DD-endopeptidase MepM/ murein hydrolase activator NlpD
MFQEPELQSPENDQSPEDDTRQPYVTVTPEGPVRGRGRMIGLISLVGAALMTLAAVALLVSPAPAPPGPQDIAQVATLEATSVQEDAAAPTPESQEELLTPAPTLEPAVIEAGFVLPTLSTDALMSLLATPVSDLRGIEAQVQRDALNPFTIIPDRPRNTLIEYTIERGDTVYDIAQRFGLTQESIAWSNDRRSLWTLTPGSTLKIPPVDGVLHIAVGSATIADIAEQYQIDDPLIIIESDANQLEGLDPSTVPPSGMTIFIPGGVAEEINWAPPVVTGSSGGSGPGGSPGTVSFEPGAPGSCAPLPPGAGTAWGAPMNRGSYTITRGYSDWHPGIDLAAPTGTPIFAANGGTVIFAGRSNWGYGLAVVISSGPFFTLYGHMSQVNVSCGQVVGTGQSVGAVGSTGNSSGPHLHFEILYGSSRTNPSATIGF